MYGRPVSSASVPEANASSSFFRPRDACTMIPCGAVWKVANTATTSPPCARASTSSSAVTVPKSARPVATICTTGTPAPPPCTLTSRPARLYAPSSRAA